MIHEKLRLSIGASPGQRAAVVAVGLVFGLISAAFVLLPVVADGLLRGPTDLLSPELGDTPTADGIGPLRYFGVCGIPFLALGLYVVLRTLRTAAWLEGTRAQVRGALRTRTVDLAAAEVTAGTVAYRSNVGPAGQIHRIPTIVARDPATGRTVTIPLRGMGLATLPPHELRAIADAMTAGRPTGERDDDVHALADQLRVMAAKPLGA